MIDALIAGRVHGKVQRRTSRNDNPYVTAAMVRTPMTNGETALVNVITFAEAAIAALLALEEGDSVAPVGS